MQEACTRDTAERAMPAGGSINLEQAHPAGIVPGLDGMVCLGVSLPRHILPHIRIPPARLL